MAMLHRCRLKTTESTVSWDTVKCLIPGSYPGLMASISLRVRLENLAVFLWPWVITGSIIAESLTYRILCTVYNTNRQPCGSLFTQRSYRSKLEDVEIPWYARISSWEVCGDILLLKSKSTPTKPICFSLCFSSIKKKLEFFFFFMDELGVDRWGGREEMSDVYNWSDKCGYVNCTECSGGMLVNVEALTLWGKSPDL